MCCKCFTTQSKLFDKYTRLINKAKVLVISSYPPLFRIININLNILYFKLYFYVIEVLSNMTVNDLNEILVRLSPFTWGDNETVAFVGNKIYWNGIPWHGYTITLDERGFRIETEGGLKFPKNVMFDFQPGTVFVNWEGEGRVRLVMTSTRKLHS